MTLATKSPSGAPMAVALPPVGPLDPPRRNSRRLSQFSGYLFLLPYLALFFTFLILPLGYGLWLSLMRYELVSPEPPAFIGLDNFREAVFVKNADGSRGDPLFWKALWATVRFVLMASPLTVLVALVLALGLNALPDRRQNLYRLGIFLPTIITISVAGLVWRWFYAAEFGVFNAILGRFGMKAPWLTSTAWAMPSIVLMTLWWTVGGPVVVLLAGLRQIPQTYYEAAAIDGAVGWRRLFFITLPLLKPVLLFVVVLNIIGAFQVFGQPFIITGGRPERSTLVLVQYVYETSFLNYRLGYGAAMSWLLFLLIAAFSLLQFRVLRER